MGIVPLKLGRALGHSIFSLIGLKRILFTIIFSKALKAPPSKDNSGVWPSAVSRLKVAISGFHKIQKQLSEPLAFVP